MNTTLLSPTRHDGEVLVIEAGRAERQYWRDVWNYRELFYFLAWRDVLVRYKQTVIGVAWSVIRPLLTTLISTFIFGRIAHLPDHGIPYPLIVFAGMLPWQFFSNALSESSGSLITNASMISKVYFPRLIVPTSTLLSGLVDFGITLGLMALMMVYYHYPPSIHIVALPLLVLLAALASMGPGLMLSALNVKYRDFKYIIPFITQFGFYISPVGYLSSNVHGPWQLAYSLNPLVAVIDGFRWCLLGDRFHIHPASFAISVAVNLLLVFAGVSAFRSLERSFADHI